MCYYSQLYMQHPVVFAFVFIYLPHNYNNYKEMPKKNVGRNGEEA